MSRIGKKPIEIPEGVEVKVEKGKVIAKGPKGELSLDIPPEVGVKVSDGEVLVSQEKETKMSKALWGTVRALVNNLIEGVSKGYAKDLQIKGVGYRAEMKDDKLVLRVGFSHPVEVEKREGVNFSVNKDIITVSGIKKDLVHRVAAEIRKIRPPEPYKGKGIRYKDEEVVLKEGKKTAGK